MIKQLEVKAFKGFRKFSITPKKVNLIIGANGTGKSNFADLLEFISVCCRFGLKDAIDKFEGLDEVRMKSPGQGRPLAMSIKIVLGHAPYWGIKKAEYLLKLSAEKSLCVDIEELHATVYSRKRGKPNPPAKVNFEQKTTEEISFKREKKSIKIWSKSLGEKPEEFDDDQELVLNAYGKIGNFRTIYEYLGSMRIYNIDSQVAKGSTNGNDSELEKNGSNLISYLRRVIEDTQLRERILKDLREPVPYIQNIVPEKILGYTTLKFAEQDSGLELRAKQMSDGTIRLLGLLSVLRQPVPPPVVVIEEPENALHAYAIRMFLRIAKEVSEEDKFPTQIFLTSHSPAVVDNLLAIDSQQEFQTQCFVTRRVGGAGTIEAAPGSVVSAIAKNLGRPSDFLREGSFDDSPHQLEIEFKKGNIV